MGKWLSDTNITFTVSFYIFLILYF
jgi:hypothetical protein